MKIASFLFKIMFAVIVCIMFSYASCEEEMERCPAEPVIVYKTKIDYSEKVSIQLSDDKQKVMSFPGIRDVENQRPIKLADGYLLKRMTGNAFLSISISDYQKLAKQPSAEELLGMVIDGNPFKEVYQCCHCASSDSIELVKLIEEGGLKECIKLKK